MKKFFIYLLGALMIVFFSFRSSEIAAAASEALMLCGGSIIPAFFPFLVCSYFIIYSGMGEKIGNLLSPLYSFVFKINGAGCIPFVLGFLGGYPQGAIFTVKMYEAGCLSKNEASRLIAFSNNPGIFFILSVLGEGVFKNRQIALIILFSNLLASVCVGLTFSFFAQTAHSTNIKPKTKKSLSLCIPDSVNTVLTLCGYIIFFSCITRLLEACNINLFLSNFLSGFGMRKEDAELIVYAIPELAGGLFRAQSMNIPLISSLVSLGGISVLCQTATVLSGSGISLKYFLLGKILSGGFACIFARLLLFFFPLPLSVSAKLSTSFSAGSSVSLTAFLWLLLIFFSFVLSKFFVPRLLDRNRNIL